MLSWKTMEESNRRNRGAYRNWQGAVCISEQESNWVPSSITAPREVPKSRKPKKLGKTHKFSKFRLNKKASFFSDGGYDHQPDKRPPFSYHGLAPKPTCTTIQALSFLPQDVGDMIGKKILMNQLMSPAGFDKITKSICSWMRGGHDFEDWVGHRLTPRITLPHTHSPLAPTISTRATAPCDYVSYKIISYGCSDCKIVWVPLWWVAVWHKGRNQAVKYANTHPFSRSANPHNWYSAKHRCLPTLGQWIEVSLSTRDNCTGDTEQWVNRRWFYDVGECEKFYGDTDDPEWKEKWYEFAKGFIHKGRKPVSFLAHQGRDDKHYDYVPMQTGGKINAVSHLGNRHSTSQCMTFCENTFFYR